MRTPVVLPEKGFRPAIFQVGEFPPFPSRRDECEPAHPPVRDGDQARTEGAVVKCESDGQPGAEVFHLPRCHGVNLHHEFVEPPGPRKPDLVCRVEDGPRCLQETAGVLCGEILEKPFRADAGEAPEEALEVVFAQPDVLCHLGKGGLFPSISL